MIESHTWKARYNETDFRAKTAFNWLTVILNGSLLSIRQWIFGFHKITFFLSVELLSVPQMGPAHIHQTLGFLIFLNSEFKANKPFKLFKTPWIRQGQGVCLTCAGHQSTQTSVPWARLEFERHNIVRLYTDLNLTGAKRLPTHRIHTSINSLARIELLIPEFEWSNSGELWLAGVDS